MRVCTVMMAALAAAPFLVSSVHAQQCGTLKEALSLNLQTGPAGLRMMVPITINGVPKQLLLDTGGGITQLSRNAVANTGLTVTTGHITTFDLRGNVSNASQVTADIGLGPYTVSQHDIPINPDPNMRLDGLFAPDLMATFDIEMDFTARKLNYFLTDHCEGGVIYWPHSTVGVVPFRGWLVSSGDTHMTVPVMLDGHQVTATVDTGATSSTLNAATAHQLFDLSPDSPGATPMGTLDGVNSHKVFGWVFKKLEIGDVTVNNPRLAVIPDIVGTKTQDTLTADSHVRRITDNFAPSMLIGMDILTKLHLYVAIKEKRLYVTAAVAPAPAAAPPAPLPDH